MLCLKQRDGRRIYGINKVVYQDVRIKIGENVTWKPIKVLTETLLGKLLEQEQNTVTRRLISHGRPGEKTTRAIKRYCSLAASLHGKPGEKTN